MSKGRIRRLISEPGHGFIRAGQRGDFFFHRNELQGVEYNSLKEG